MKLTEHENAIIRKN